MQNFMKTILSAVQTWTKGKIKDSTADWSQNNSSKDSYVKNRTHWEEEIEVVLVDSLTFADYDSGNAPKCNFVVGQKYNIVWNGTLYEGLVCYSDGEFNVIASSHLGCPFYIDDDGGNSLYIEYDNGDYTVSISTIRAVVHKLDPKYLNIPTNLATTDDVQSALDVANEAYQIADNVDDNLHTVETNLATKMDATNPTGTGSFSMNRMSGTVVGDYSHAEGCNTTASAYASHAEGYATNACSDIVPSTSYAGGYQGQGSHAEGINSTTYGVASHAEGLGTFARSHFSHTEGMSTIAQGRSQHVQGEYNIIDEYNKYGTARGTYAHIVGNGSSDTERSNAHTLDWNGNAWYQGDVYIGGTSQNDATALGQAINTLSTEKVSKSGDTMSGWLDFGNQTHGLKWTTADGTAIHLRPYTDGNLFQLTMQNSTTGVAEYGVVNIKTNGDIEFNNPSQVRKNIGAVTLEEVVSALPTWTGGSY